MNNMTQGVGGKYERDPCLCMNEQRIVMEQGSIFWGQGAAL